MTGKLSIGSDKPSAAVVTAVDGGTPMATGPPGEA